MHVAWTLQTQISRNWQIIWMVYFFWKMCLTSFGRYANIIKK